MSRSKTYFSLARGNLTRRGTDGVIYARFQHKGKRYLRATGRSDETGARAVAWQIYQDVVAGKDTVVERQPRTASVQACLDLYLEHAPKMERPVKRQTARNNASAVRSFCAAVWPERSLQRIEVADLDAAAVRKFRQRRRTEAGVEAESEDLTHNYRLNRVLAKARSVWGVEARRMYASHDLVIPEDVLRAPMLREPQRLARPVNSAQVFRAHLAVARKYKYVDPRALVVFEIMRYAGLRDSEVLAMRRHWIRLDGDIGYIDVINRSPLTDPGKTGYRPKNGRDRSVPVRGKLIRRWLDLLPGIESYGYVIESEDRTLYARWWRELSLLVHEYWPDRNKSLYELRRYAGSVYLSKTRDVPGTAAFLGDTIQVTYSNYAWLLDESRAVPI